MGCEEGFKFAGVTYLLRQKYGTHSHDIVLALEVLGRISPDRLSCRNEGTMNLTFMFLDV